MRNVVYVAPFPMRTTMRFAHALATLDGVRLLGVFNKAPTGVAARVFDDVIQVGDVLDPGSLIHGVGLLSARYGRPHRILGILENLQESLAAARAHYGVYGTDLQTTRRFRDKGLMKDALRQAGIPCAAHARLTSPHDAIEFVKRNGFPVVLKPPDGAGCRATYRCDSLPALEQALAQTRPSPQRPVLAEEFLTGEEYSFETITVGGEPQFYSVGRYYPTPLEVMENDWLQWVVVLPRELNGFEKVREVGLNAVRRLGMSDGMTHMEWFRRPDGSVAVGEIAMRPPGAQFVRLMSLAYDADMYRAWARAAVDGAFDGPWERKYSVGIAYLRGSGRGRITHVEGLDEAQRMMGHLVHEAQLPQVGMPRSDSYEGDGWAIVRHPDTRIVTEAMRLLVSKVRVHYSHGS
ncbi:MAG: ATP-grasp domain-containing protein [Alphaproteobacteria bacterium]|nr:ATP-grasp domain-containing protein [Alphaproteobacteria bacterium]